MDNNMDKFNSIYGLSSEEGPASSDSKKTSTPSSGGSSGNKMVDFYSAMGIKPERTLKGTVQDVGAVVAGGVNGALDSVVGLANIPTLGQAGRAKDLIGLQQIYDDPREAEKVYLEAQGKKAAGDHSWDIPSAYSEAQQYAQKQVSDADGVWGKAKAALSNPSTIATTVGESIPSMFTGGLIGRGIAAGSKLVSPIVGAAIGEGIVGGGSAAEQIRQESPTGTLTPTQAAMAVGSGIGTSIFGYVGGKVANKLGFEDADTMIANGFQRMVKKDGEAAAKKGFAQSAGEVAARIVGGGISEGAFEELPQSIQEQMWQNAATGKPLTEGMDEATVMGFLSGFAMGGPVNAMPKAGDVSVQQPGPTGATPQPKPVQSAQQATAGPISRALGQSTSLVTPPYDLSKAEGDIASYNAQGMGMPVTEDNSVLAQQYHPSQSMGTIQRGQMVTPQPGVDLAASARREDDIRAAFAEDDQRKASEKRISDEADNVIAAIPEYSVMADIKKRGGLNLAAFKGDYDRTSVNQLDKRYPGLFSSNGKIMPDEAADEHGYGSLDNMVQAFLQVPTKSEALARVKEDYRAQEGQAKEAEKIQKETGINLSSPQTIPVGNLDTGDKVVVVGSNGLPDVVTHKGYDGDGKAILKDGVTIHADPWDTVDSMGVKPAAQNDDVWVNPNQNGVPRYVGVGDQLTAPQADTSGFLRDQQIRNESVGRAPVVRQPGESTSDYLQRKRDEKQMRQTMPQSVTSLVSPSSDTQGFLRDQQIRGGAQGTVKDSLTVQPRKTMRQVIEERKAAKATLNQQAHEAATSPQNDKPEPTQAQKEVGNYAVGHVKLHGLDISIENPQGSERKGVDPSGKPWSVKMKHHYGYFKGTIGPDKDHVDVFIGPKQESEKVFVVDQVDPKTGKFDEPKVVLGAVNKMGAKKIYLSNYEKGWKGAGALTEMTLDQFKEWAYNPKTSKKPAAEFISGQSTESVQVKSQPSPQSQAVPGTPKTGRGGVDNGSKGVIRSDSENAGVEETSTLEQKTDTNGQQNDESPEKLGVKSRKQDHETEKSDSRSREQRLEAFRLKQAQDNLEKAEAVKPSEIRQLERQRQIGISDAKRILAAAEGHGDRISSLWSNFTDVTDRVFEQREKQAQTTPKTTSKSDLPGVGTETPSSKGEGSKPTVKESLTTEKQDVSKKEMTEPVSESTGDKYQGFNFSENDISRDLAYSAHVGSSFSPDKRAEQERAGYAEHMRNVIDSLSKHAKTDEQVSELKSWFNGYYKPKYLKLQNALLSANSRTMSSMITGPANFPTRSNQKKLDTAHKRLTELLEWDEKAKNKMRRQLTGTGIISSTDSDAKEKLQKKLDSLVGAHEMMKSANKIIRNKKLSDSEKIEELKKVGLSEKNAGELLKPDFAGRVGFASYALQNNNAEIKRIKGRIAELEKRAGKAEEVGGFVEKEFEGGKVEANYDDGYLRIYHDEKPSEEVRSNLKSNGFRWAPSEGAWRRKLNRQAEWAAEKVTGVKFSKAKPAENPADIKQEISASLGRLRTLQLMKKGVLNIVGSQEEAKADISGGAEPFYSQETGAIQGYTKDGKVTLVSDGIESGNAFQVFLHEVTHLTRLGIRADAHFSRILKMIDENRGKDSPLGKAIAAAESRIPADTPAAHRTEEILSYMVENDKGNVSLVRRFIAMVKKALINLGISPEILKPADFKALAVNAAKWKGNVAVGEGVMKSVRDVFRPVDVESENFKKWFAGSVFRGKVYSGQPKGRDVFDNVVRGELGGVGYFTKSKDVAALYAGTAESELSGDTDFSGGRNGEIGEYYISSKNPYDPDSFDIDRQDWLFAISEEYDADFEDMSDAEKEESGWSILVKKFGYPDSGRLDIDEFLDDGGTLTQYVRENVRPETVGSDYYAEGISYTKFGPLMLKFPEVFEKIRIRKGFDSIVYSDGEHGGHETIVPFSPTQIKSATSNTGAFSQTDPRIQYSTSNIFKKVDPNSPTLKRWLGNSQITEPVYHGSPDEFYTFDRNKLGRNTSSPGVGLGFFFAQDRNESQGYAGPGNAPKSFYVKMESPKRMNSYELPKFRGADEAQAYAKRQQLAGYDGIILEDEGHVIAFEPNQVKSAELNTGEFDGNNPDVRYSVASKKMDKFNVISSQIKGMKYSGIYDNERMLSELSPGMHVDLVREPDNAHDANAVKIQISGVDVGYISRTNAKNLAKRLDAGEEIKGIVSMVSGNRENTRVTIVFGKQSDLENYKAAMRLDAAGESARREEEERILGKKYSDAIKDVLDNGLSAASESGMFDAMSKKLDVVDTGDASFKTKAIDWLKSVPKAVARRGLGAMTLMQLDEVYGEKIPEMTTYYQTTRDLASSAMNIMSEAQGVYDNWVNLGKEDAKNMSEIMIRGTISGVNPDADKFEPRANIMRLRQAMDRKLNKIAELKKSGFFDETEINTLEIEVKQHAERIKDEVNRRKEYPLVKKLYDGLSDDAKKVYQDVKGMYSRNLERLFNALEARMERQVKDPKQRKITIDAIRMRYDKYMKEGPYFPLSRFGDYLAISKKEGEKREVRTFDTLAERTRYTRERRAQGWKVQEKTAKEFSKETQGASGSFVTGLVGAIEDNPSLSTVEKKSIIDEVNQHFIKSMPDLSHRKHFAHRRKVEGYSEDQMRAFALNMQHAAHHISRIRHADKMTTAVESMLERSKQVEGNSNVDDLTDLHNELVKRLELMNNPNVSPVASAITSFGFLMNIGPSIASALVNTTQTPLVAFPVMSTWFKKQGAGAAFNALRKASADYFTSKPSIATGPSLINNKKLPIHERAAIQALVNDGTIETSMAMSLAQASGEDFLNLARTKHGNTALKVMRLVSYPFHIAEIANRKITALAAYRMAKAEGQSHTEAINTAREITLKGHFDYSRLNRARFMEGNVQRVLFLFKQYSQQMTWLLGRSFQQAIKGETQEVKDIARKRLAMVIGGHFMLSGALGMPVVGSVLGALSMLGGGDDDPWDAEVAFRNWLNDTFGKGIGESIAHGPWRAIPGIGDFDLSSRVSLGDLWFRGPNREMEGMDKFNQYVNLVLGPIASNAANVFMGLNAMNTGETWRGMEMMLPKAVKDGMKTIRYAREGVKNWKNDTLIDELSTVELFGQSLGFTPSRISEMYEGANAIKNRESVLENRRQSLVNKWVQAIRRQDASASREALDDIAKFNSLNPVFRINGSSLRKSLRNRISAESKTKQGVYLPSTRNELREYGRFANVD